MTPQRVRRTHGGSTQQDSGTSRTLSTHLTRALKRAMLLGVFMVAILAPLAATPPALAGQTPNSAYGHTGWRDPQIVLGDSTTWHAWQLYRTSGYTGELNGLSSRSVEELLPLVRERVRSRSAVRTAVIALGTNGGHQTFTRDQYVTAVNLLKAHGATRIVLVTPYRDVTWSDHGRVAQRAGWMRQIAANRHGVCAADWAAYARVHPEALIDGIHYTETGGVEYMRLINERLRGVCS